MTTLCGRFVKTFNEATHALPDGMHMDADYPFMMPKIIATLSGSVLLQSDRDPTLVREAMIKRTRTGREFCTIRQWSSFEQIFIGKKPTLFRCYPFKEGAA